MPYARRRSRFAALCLLGLLCLGPIPVRAAPFEVVYTDSPGQGFLDAVLGAGRRGAFQRAADAWGAELLGDTPVRVETRFRSLGGTQYGAPLAYAAPKWLISNFDNAPQADVWYPSALADSLVQTDLIAADADIRVTFNSDIDGAVLGDISWHYGPENPPGRDVDFQTVAMHELGHGLGFFSSFRSNGSWGYNDWPVIFDTLVVNAAGQRLIDLPKSPANVTGAAFFSGPQATEAWQESGRGGYVPLFAPSQWRSGSSLSHLDEATFRGLEELMTPYYDHAVRQIDLVALSVLADLGWGAIALQDQAPDPGSLILLASGALTILLFTGVRPARPQAGQPSGGESSSTISRSWSRSAAASS